MTLITCKKKKKKEWIKWKHDHSFSGSFFVFALQQTNSLCYFSFKNDTSLSCYPEHLDVWRVVMWHVGTGGSFYNTGEEIDPNAVSYLRDRKTSCENAAFGLQSVSTEGERIVVEWRHSEVCVGSWFPRGLLGKKNQELVYKPPNDGIMWKTLHIARTVFFFFNQCRLWCQLPPFKHTTRSPKSPPSASITVRLQLMWTISRRKLVHGEHNRPGQKRPNAVDRTFQQERAEGDVWAAASARAGERNFTADIHLPPESRFITSDKTERRTAGKVEAALRPQPRPRARVAEKKKKRKKVLRCLKITVVFSFHALLPPAWGAPPTASCSPH